MRSEDANSLPVDRELAPPYGSHRGVRVGGRAILRDVKQASPDVDVVKLFQGHARQIPGY